MVCTLFRIDRMHFKGIMQHFSETFSPAILCESIGRNNGNMQNGDKYKYKQTGTRDSNNTAELLYTTSPVALDSTLVGTPGPV